LDKYVVKLYTRAYQDLNDIYTYIAERIHLHQITVQIVVIKKLIFLKINYRSMSNSML